MKEYNNMPSPAPPPQDRNEKDPGALSAAISSMDEALEQIDRILHQMLLLAELSASNADVERERLQKTLERLQAKIDRIADTITPSDHSISSFGGPAT